MASYYGSSRLTPEQVAQIFYQAGARGGDLEFFVAVAKRESGYDPAAHRTDSDRARLSGDRGLAQINAIWDQQLKAAGIITQSSDLFNPVTNAKAAMYVLGKQGRAAWGMGSNGWDGGGNPLHNTDIDAARTAVQNAQQQGLLGQNYAGGGGTGGGGVAGPIPTDGQVIRVNGVTYIVYPLGAGVTIRFNVTDPSQIAGRPVVDITAQHFAERYQKGVLGGDAKELTTVASSFGTFGKFWDSIINQVMGENNPAAKDPEVRRVIAEFAGRPDMSQAELQNKLKATKYWQTKTEGELQWNSLSEAERVARREDTAARMVSTWFQFVGTHANTYDPAIREHLEAVASGKMSFSSWTERYLKPRALEVPESPWARTVRTEGEDRRQRGVDIENTVSKIRQTLDDWGLVWDEKTLMSWAKSIVENKKSDDDLLQTIKGVAQSAFATKPPDLDTKTWASPWIETYNRVMETEGSLQTTEVRRALANGEQVWDFEQRLKKSDGWLKTKNARDEMFSLAAEVGSRMGYV
jgi:hypothetical protein